MVTFGSFPFTATTELFSKIKPLDLIRFHLSIKPPFSWRQKQKKKSGCIKNAPLHVILEVKNVSVY